MIDPQRPDVNGVPPKMQAIGEKAKEVLTPTPFFLIKTDDFLMSSVTIIGSFDAKEEWSNGYIENSRLFRFTIKPKNGRYYDSTDEKVTVELSQASHKITRKFRKFTGTIDEVLEKIQAWLLSKSWYINGKRHREDGPAIDKE